MFASGINVLRAFSNEGSGRPRYYADVRQRLETDPQMRRYFEGETTDIPDFWLNHLQRTTGPLHAYLPPGALHHDQNAYLKSTAVPLGVPRSAATHSAGVKDTAPDAPLTGAPADR